MKQTTKEKTTSTARAKRGNTRAIPASNATRPSMEMAKAWSTPVPPEQWNMPAGFRPDGQVATLKEVADPKVPTLSLGEINPAQRIDLVVKRIEQQPDFKIAMVGAGLVDKDRAIAEVKSQSNVGKVLAEIEQRVINNLVDRATKGYGSKTSKETKVGS